MPEEGKNAISMLMREVGDATEKCGLANFYNKYIGFDVHGERLGIDMEDKESGRLTLNVGKIDMDDENVTLYMDIRHPVTKNSEDILAAIREIAEPSGITLEVEAYKPPVYMDKDGDFIRKLVDVYHEVTGLEGEAMVIGGGTYARAMDNIVAFGPMLPGRETTEHQRNERIPVEDFLLLREIYKEAFIRICCD